jgi:phosphoribosyl 1,2-cyclic phosphodiesterase
MGEPGISVRFWGVRGSVPCPGPATLRYGGNTACVEMRCGEHLLIFDAGSGIRGLGCSLMKDPSFQEADIFFSHCHIDHLIGLPFFQPFHSDGNRFRLWAGHDQSLHLYDQIATFMSHPLFPVSVETFRAAVEYKDFRLGSELTPRPGITIKTVALTHPGGATGYRVEHGSRAVAYLTDVELGGSGDAAVLALAKGADLLIIDATYTEAELPAHAGWGHSSWQRVVSFAERAGAARLCLFHHDPEHDDDFMDRIAAAAVKARAGTIVAREGLELKV